MSPSPHSPAALLFGEPWCLGRLRLSNLRIGKPRDHLERIHLYTTDVLSYILLVVAYPVGLLSKGGRNLGSSLVSVKQG
jgi:hypothetical protein